MKNMTLANIAKAANGQLIGGEGRENLEITGAELDSRKIKEGNLFFATPGERVDGHKFIADVFEKGAYAAVCEKLPENPAGPCILVESSFQALEDIAAFYRRQIDCRVVAITGSVGKTSTKEVVASVLSEKYNVLKTEGNLNNNIGLPLMVLRIRDEHKAAVLEMGISHFDEMERMSRTALPDIAVITNIGTSHIENLGTQEGIYKEKSHIFDYLPENGHAVVWGDDPILKKVENAGGKKPLTYGRDAACTVFCKDEVSKGLLGSDFCVTSSDGRFAEDFDTHMPLPGPHMVNNALCASLIGSLFGLSEREISAGIRKVKPMNGRSNLIKTSWGLLIDDCYNANPASMESAIDMLSLADGRKIAILGDMFELGENAPAMHREVGEYTKKADPALVVCVGELSENMAEGAASVLGKDKVQYYKTLDSFLENIDGLLQEGDTCLVKASHGMNFAKIVEKIGKKVESMIREEAEVLSVEKLADGVWRMDLKTGLASLAKPGQFVMVGSHSESHLLMRPISISEIDKKEGILRLVWRTVGYGTNEMAAAKAGDHFTLLGPLGNGFPVQEADNKKHIMLIGGGIGAPPLLGMMKALSEKHSADEITAVLGYRGESAGLFLADDFKKYGNVVISSDDGSVGTHGTVIDAIKENALDADIIYSCGPMPMLSAVKKFAAEKGITAWISLEERMACGVGACLGCVVKTKHVDHHSHVNNARICTEGPVFDAEEVEI